MSQKLENLKINRDNIEICFGSRQFFRKQFHLPENNYKSHEKWYNDFVKRRDCSLYYLGSSDETCGNQMCQIYHVRDNLFDIKIRKENKFSEIDKYVWIRNLKITHLSEELIQALRNRQAMTVLISRKDNKLYVNISFTLSREIETTHTAGVIGIDFNDGFAEAVETNYSGNMVNAWRVPFEKHGAGNAAKTEMRQKVSGIVKKAKKLGKTIVIEDLDFRKRKSRTLPDYAKKYNSMIHLLDYSRFGQYLHNACVKSGVRLKQVNPAYTSKIGKEKYAPGMKLSIHRAAAFVIARKGQGYNDFLKKEQDNIISSAVVADFTPSDVTCKVSSPKADQDCLVMALNRNITAQQDSKPKDFIQRLVPV